MKLKTAFFLTGILAIAGCGGSGSNQSPPPPPVPDRQDLPDPIAGITDSSQYNDISVHDPSIVKVDGTYYVFGSHLAAAKSTDLMNWQSVSNSVSDTPLFNTYASEIAEGIAWTDGFVGNWAADVIQSPNGKFWFYYNHCGQDNPDTAEFDEVCWHRSYLGLAVSDSVEGPYSNQGIFLRSGHREGELETYPLEGITSYNPAVHPNAIDPAAFYDKDGNLWLVYGSYSGGIFILAMDENTGMPEPGQGFGKHLVGGNFNAIEGSFVIYSAQSDYYYLFWSNAAFGANGGYNIRVARSRTPDGPYLDAAGNDMVGATVANNFGNKLLGSHLWAAAFGEHSAQYGYNAPGHNSALYDEQLDKYLLFTHTRFPQEERRYDNAEAHAVRVHEMWLNNDDWLVVSPHRYAPIDGDNLVDAGDIAGDYRLILQGKDSNSEEHTSVYVTLTLQGRNVQGELTGVYNLYNEQPGRVRISIDNDSTYEAVAKWQWNVEDERFEVVLSGVNALGESLIGAKLPAKSAVQIIDDIKLAVEQTFTHPTDPTQTFVTKQNLVFPETAARGAKMSWSSDKPGYIAASGTVNRPNVGEGDQTVRLTATITLAGQSSTVIKDIIVAERAIYNRTAQYSFEDNLSDSLQQYADAVAAVSVADTAPISAVYIDGPTGRAVNLDGSYGVLLPDDLIDSYQYTVAFWFNQHMAEQFFRPAFFGARSAEPARWTSFLPVSWNAQLMLWSNYVDDAGNVSWLDGITGVTYPVNEWHHLAFAVKNGAFQIYYDGVQVGAGSNLRDIFSHSPEGNVISLGLNYWDAPTLAAFDELSIYDEALTGAEIKALEVDRLPPEQLLSVAQQTLDLGHLDYVVADVNLPQTGPFTAALSWTSSDDTVIEATTGKVTRPPSGAADATVTLTATLTLAGESTSKQFVARVISLTPSAPIARFSFENNLADSSGNFAAGEPADKTAEQALITPTDKVLTYADGVVGKAVKFNGDEGPGAKLPDGLITDFSYSIALWLMPATKTQYSAAFFGYAANNSWVSVVPWGPSGESMVWSGEQWFDGNLGSLIPNESWSHVVIVVNEGQLSAYLNGQLVATMAGFPDVFTAVGSASVFALATNLFPWDANFNGLMDELVIFDEPITSEQVQALYAEGSSQ